jgi:hypothetical protein
MSGLLSNAQLNALAKIAESGMKTSVTIKRRTFAETALESKAPVWTTVGTCDGWLRMLPGDNSQVLGGSANVGVTHRLFVPRNTDLRSNDKVLINSEEYTVMDTTVENTYKVLLRCALRKAE